MKRTAIDNIIEKEKGLLVSVARAIGSTAGTVVARMNASTKPTHRTLSGTKTKARVAKSRKNNPTKHKQKRRSTVSKKKSAKSRS